jgi:hypothetical protein
VGVSVEEGKRMEKSGKEYVCVKCADQEKSTKAEREKNRTLRQNRREQIRAQQLSELHQKKQIKMPSSSSSSSRIKQTRKCIGPACEKMASDTSIYCSEECIKKHVEFSLKKLEVRGLAKPSSTPGDFVKGSGGITVVNVYTKKLITGVTAPSGKTLVPWLKAHPTYKVHIPSDKVVMPTKKQPMRKSIDDEGMETAPSAGSSHKKQMNSEGTRKHARKALQQALQTRFDLLPPDERTASEKDLIDLAADIELKLFNLFNQEVNQKYRTKCRSLLFNLKDSKNEGLFKKILVGTIPTKQLVRMTPEQLASDELAEWREKTIKKELEMITEVAKEQLEMSSGSVRKMTYKGEIEIERNSDIPPLNEEVTSTTEESNLKEEQQQTPHSSLTFSIMADTTSEHGQHIFDHNCLICSGKTKQPKEEDKETHREYNEDEPRSYSPDSGGIVNTDDNHISPDSVTEGHSHQSSSSPSLLSSSLLQSVWCGNLSMHSMETFSANAYHVSGRLDQLPEVFPETLQIIGRIGHAQVWDYLEKLRTSSSKEVVVLRFERIENDETTYLDMMDYLIEKRRYGVMQPLAYIKDMYLIPLLFNDPVPPQLLPFSGPGLPFNRKDMFLCIITRPKHVKIMHEPSSRKHKHTSKVRFAQSPDHVTTPTTPPEKKPPHSQLAEAGEGVATPPLAPPIISFYGDSKDFDNKPEKPEVSEHTNTTTVTTTTSSSSTDSSTATSISSTSTSSGSSSTSSSISTSSSSTSSSYSSSSSRNSSNRFCCSSMRSSN